MTTHEMTLVSFGEPVPRLYTKAELDAAVAAERERCAKICLQGVQSATDWDSSYWDQACENRAAAIKEQSV